MKLLLYAENRTDSPSWLPHQKGAVEAVTVSRPLPALSLLIPAIFDTGNTLNTKFLVTDCLVGAAVTLQDNSHPELGRYVALAVGGLAAGSFLAVRGVALVTAASAPKQCAVANVVAHVAPAVPQKLKSG